MVNTNSLLSELNAVFGDGFSESVGDDSLDEVHGRLAPMSTSQQNREKKRPTALKNALAAFSREGERGIKKRGVAQHRKMIADIEKAAKKDNGDPDDLKKALADLKAMRKDRDAKGSEDGAKSKEKSKSKEKPKAKVKAKPDVGGASSGGGGKGGESRAKQKGAAGSGSKGHHDPFKRSSNLGLGPGTPPGFKKVQGSRHHNKSKCWNCDCGPIYSKGCLCTGTGATKNCPENQKKHVVIKKDYRDAYNKMYHAWRAKKGGDVTARVGAGRPGSF